MSDRIEIKNLDLLETVSEDDEIAVQRKADGVVYKAEKATLRGDKGDTGDTGDAATVDAGATTTGAAGTNANVVNSGTTSAAVFDFTIPRGDKGETGDTGATGPQGPAGDDAYVYIAYASDDQGTDFTLTFNPTLNYIAILSTDTEIPSPVAGDFTGLWKQLADNSNYFNSNRIAQTGTSPYESLGGAVNGTNTTLTVPGSFYISGTLVVYLNGKLIIANDGWSETLPSSGTFDFVDPPLTGDVVTAFFQDQELSADTVITTSDKASQAEAEAGTENEKYMTALRTKQAIDELGLQPEDNIMGTIIHGATAGTARPSGFLSVTWIGSVEPTNATNDDIWIDNS